MDGKGDYSLFEHRHRFAAWAAARAAQRGLKNGTNAVLTEAIERCSAVDYIRSDLDRPISPNAYDQFHRTWVGEIVQHLSAHCPTATYGRGAKLLAVYIKSMVIVGPNPACDLAKVAHPPVDALLLKGISRRRDVEPSIRLKLKQAIWTEFDQDAYFEAIHALRALLSPGQPFWMLEADWRGS